MADNTPDGRYVIIDGRRWQATDPSLPDDVRTRLVNELMAARRAVRDALATGDEQAERRARSRAHDAKVALGERGRPWWETSTPDETQARAAATQRALRRTAG